MLNSTIGYTSRPTPHSDSGFVFHANDYQRHVVEKFAQMRIWTAWRTSLRARLPESGWRPKPARVVTPFEISPPLRQERSEEHTSELQSLTNLVCRLLLEKKKKLAPLLRW